MARTAFLPFPLSSAGAANVIYLGATLCRRKFELFYPAGFEDETYLVAERSHKERAHLEWDAELAPATFRKLLARCLDRNPKDRLRDIGEVRFLLAETAVAAETSAFPTAPSRSRLGYVSWAVAAVSVLAGAAMATVHFREQPPDSPKPVRFQFAPENVTIGPNNRFALSPDGTKLAFLANGSDGATRLWVRAMVIQPMIGVSGVLSSWLRLARNRIFTLSASSARAFATSSSVA